MLLNQSNKDFFVNTFTSYALIALWVSNGLICFFDKLTIIAIIKNKKLSEIDRQQIKKITKKQDIIDELSKVNKYLIIVLARQRLLKILIGVLQVHQV